MAGRNPTVHVRYFLGEAISTRACGCRPGDAEEYRFWNAWGLKVPKTGTPPRPPGNAGDYRTCAVFVWREGTLHVRYFLGEAISTRACGCRPGDAGEYRFWNAWGLKVPQTCTPVAPRAMQGTTELVLSLYGGKEPYCTRSLLLRRNNQYAGLRVPAGDAGEYRSTELVLSLYGGKEPYCTRSLLLRRSNQEAGLRVPARGRGEVQVLERLGLESAENLYSSAPPGQCRGLQNLCCLCMAGRNPTVHVRYFLGEAISTRACGCRPGDAGSTGFGTLGALQCRKPVLPRAPRAMQGTTELVLSLYGGKEPYGTRSTLLLRRSNQYAGLRVPARGRGGVQVLERLGLESAENLYSPAPPGQCRGLQNLCCRCMAGRNPTRSLLLRRSNQYAGLRVPARGRGGVQVLERLGLESAQNLYSPAPPGAMQGTTELVLSLYGGKEPYCTRSLLLRRSNQYAGLRVPAGNAGEYRFWNAWGLKVPKTCTPPCPPGNAGDCRTCAVFVWRERILHVRYFLGETINKRACGCPAARGSTGFGTLGA